jgi:acyl dehydratase
LSNIKHTEDQKNTIGYTIVDRKTIYESDVIEFARLSGDYNPIHIDESFASKSIFKKRVAHGMYIASFFSKILGNEKYGYSGIYLNQNLIFLNPVYINDTVDVVVILNKINNFKSTLIFKTMCMVEKKVVVDGTAEILIKKNSNSLQL